MQFSIRFWRIYSKQGRVENTNRLFVHNKEKNLNVLNFLHDVSVYFKKGFFFSFSICSVSSADCCILIDRMLETVGLTGIPSLWLFGSPYNFGILETLFYSSCEIFVGSFYSFVLRTFNSSRRIPFRLLKSGVFLRLIWQSTWLPLRFLCQLSLLSLPYHF